MATPLTASCAKCGTPVFPRVHRFRRDAICQSCHEPNGLWHEGLGISRPALPGRRLKATKVATPSLGDFVLAAMTGKGFGTKAWLTANLSEALNRENIHNQNGNQATLELVLSELEQLGHIELTSDRLRWWIRPHRWVPDQAHYLSTENGTNVFGMFAIGARPATFWSDSSNYKFTVQPVAAIPMKVATERQEVTDVVAELSEKLPQLDDWIANQGQVELPSDRGTLLRDGRVSKIVPAPGVVFTWKTEMRHRVYAAQSKDCYRAVPFGVARIISVGALPFARERKRFAIPRMFQPPMPFRRVLTLCSGLLPYESTDSLGQIWHVFDGVDDAVYRSLERTLPLREIK